jgi:hypothetical protein
MAVSRVSTSSILQGFPKSRSLLIGNPPYIPSDYESIATATGTGSSGSVTFSNIPQGYQHLQVRYISKSTWAPGQVADILAVRLNGDTTSAYRFHSIYSGNGPSPSTATNTGTYFGDSFACNASNLPSNTYATGILDILDYTNTNKTTTVRLMSGVETNGYYTGNFWGAAFSSGLWSNTATVTSISLFSNNGNLYSNSRFALYGIKG